MVVRATIQCVQMVSQLEHLSLPCSSPRITPYQRHDSLQEKRLQPCSAYGTIRPRRWEGSVCPLAVGTNCAQSVTVMPCVQACLLQRTVAHWTVPRGHCCGLLSKHKGVTLCCQHSLCIFFCP